MVAVSVTSPIRIIPVPRVVRIITIIWIAPVIGIAETAISPSVSQTE
jgi:hypothetical protein